MNGEPLRIAMWSGPRNISTAMMRAFENRPDTGVVDEPFYAAYLAASGARHPMRDAVLRSQPTDWRKVVEILLGPAPNGRAIFYQKHMTHHMLPDIGTDWMARCTNVFLIRRPEEVVASYDVKRGEASWPVSKVQNASTPPVPRVSRCRASHASFAASASYIVRR